MTDASSLSGPAHHPRRRWAALALAAALVLAACGGDDSGGDASASGDPTSTTAAEAAPSTSGAAAEAAPSTSDTAADPAGSTTTVVDTPATQPEALTVATPATYAVGSDDATVIDDTRVTAAQNGQAELPQRSLDTLVLYPAEGPFVEGEDAPDAPPEPGPWPLVVFSHGLGGSGPAYTATLRVWASAGYVVVAPTYPLSSSATPGGASFVDLPNQPADVSVLVDWVVAGAEGAPWAASVDTERVGLAGHSMGGFTSLAAGYNPCCLDDRVDAVAEWAGGYLPALEPAQGTEGGAPVDDGPPLLIVHGDADGTVPYEQADATATAVGGPWWLVTLVGGPHIPPYVQGLGVPDSSVVTLTTLDLFDEFLKGDPEGTDRLETVVADAGPGVATLATAEG